MAQSRFSLTTGDFINTMLWGNTPSGLWSFNISQSANSATFKLVFRNSGSDEVKYSETRFEGGTFSWVFFQNNTCAIIKNEIKQAGNTKYILDVFTNLNEPANSKHYAINLGLQSSGVAPQLHFHPSTDGKAYFIFLTDGGGAPFANRSHSHYIIRTDIGSVLCSWGVDDLQVGEISRNARATSNKFVQIYAKPNTNFPNGIRIINESQLPLTYENIKILSFVPASASNKPGDENVKIKNIDNQDVDLTKWSLGDLMNHRYYFPDGFIIKKNKSVTVWTKSGTDDDTNLYMNRMQAVWNNDKDVIYLRDETDSIVDIRSYQKATGTTIPKPIQNQPPAQPPKQRFRVVDEIEIRVPESAKFVDTGVDVKPEHYIDGEAKGEIWAGVWFTGGNDANGWIGWEAGDDYPIPREAPFCLIAGVGIDNWDFVLGTSFGPIKVSRAGRLFLRINDNVPNNGDGAFKVTINILEPIIN